MHACDSVSIIVLRCTWCDQFHKHWTPQYNYDPVCSIFKLIIMHINSVAVFRVEEVRAENLKDIVSPIDEDSARISIPREVLEGSAEGAPVRMASFLFRNMTGLLPESLGDENQNDTVMLVYIG